MAKENDYIAGLYALLTLILPFIIDTGISGGVFFVLWLGGSFIAGIFVSPIRVVAITTVALAALLGVMIFGVVDTEFFSDPLTSVALVMLAGGEILAALGGRKVSLRWGQRSNR